MRLDFGRFNLVAPDSFYMLPALFWPFLIALLISLFVLTYLTNHARFVLAVSAFLIIFFPLLQWPVVFGWDQYLHTYIATSLTESRDVLSQYSVYGQEYPGAYVTISFFRNITGIDSLNLAIFLAVTVKVLTLTFVYIVSKYLVKAKYACFALLLFILGNFRFADYFQFSPQALAFPLFLFLLYLYLRPLSRNQFVMVLLSILSVVILHLFTAILMLTTFLCIYLVQWFFRRTKTKIQTFLIIGFAVYLVWQTCVATSVSEEGVRHIIDIVREGFSVTNFVSPILTFGRGVYNEMLLGYKQFLLVSISVGALAGSILGFKEKTGKFFVSVLLGAMMFSVALIVLSEPPSRIFLDRAILLGLLAPVILTTYVLARLCERRARLRLIVSLLFIILIIPSFFANYQYVYMFTVKDWEIVPLRFLSTHYREIIGITSDGITLIFLRNVDIQTYANRTFTGGYTLNRFSSDLASVNRERILASMFILRSYRQKVDWYYTQGTHPDRWDAFDNNLLLYNSNYSRVYDNNYIQMYVRAHQI